MNKSIQDQLNAIIKGNDNPDSYSVSDEPVSFSNKHLDLKNDDIKSEINDFFVPSSNVDSKEIDNMSNLKEGPATSMSNFRAKKEDKQLHEDDVKKFIDSLPSKQAVLTTSLNQALKKNSPEKLDDKKNIKEDVKVREMTEDYLVKMAKRERISDVHELDLSYQKIHRIQKLERFTSIKKLCLDGNRIEKITCFKHLRQLNELSICDNLLKTVQGIESCMELEYADFNTNKISNISNSDFSNNKKMLELNLSYNPIESFAGLRNLDLLETLIISNNNLVTSIKSIPHLPSLERLSADYCKISSLRLIHQKFPCLNIASLVSNCITHIEEIEHLQYLEYFPQLDIRMNPLADHPGAEALVTSIAPDLEIYNDKQIKETGLKYKRENEMLKQQIKLEEVIGDMKDEVFEDILNDIFKDDDKQKDKMNLINSTLEKAEEGAFKAEEKLILSNMNINNKL